MSITSRSYLEVEKLIHPPLYTVHCSYIEVEFLSRIISKNLNQLRYIVAAVRPLNRVFYLEQLSFDSKLEQKALKFIKLGSGNPLTIPKQQVIAYLAANYKTFLNHREDYQLYIIKTFLLRITWARNIKQVVVAGKATLILYAVFHRKRLWSTSHQTQMDLIIFQMYL